MTFGVGQVVVLRRDVWKPDRFVTRSGEWVVRKATGDGRVLVESLDGVTDNGDPVRMWAKVQFLCTPEERVAEELMA